MSIYWSFRYIKLKAMTIGFSFMPLLRFMPFPDEI
jgi:hypothetical protein